MVDLRNCKIGDKLISKHGMILIYEGPCPSNYPYAHLVKYPNGSMGSRTHEGYVFLKMRLPEDHDIVEILKEQEG